ncbi:Cytochrome P450 [Gryllus bimaculatus]|nr:Cytochrome P450 [Gryllus bimaculatus]
MRFALAQVKMGAAALVRACDIRLTPRSPPNPPPLDPSSFLYGARGGLWLHFAPLDARAD